MTYIRDRRRLVPTRASLMNSPIKFDQLNLSWPLFSLSLSLPHSPSFSLFFSFYLSFFLYFFFFLSMFIFFSISLIRSYFFFFFFLCLYDRFFFYKYRACVYIILCISVLVVCHFLFVYIVSS